LKNQIREAQEENRQTESPSAQRSPRFRGLKSFLLGDMVDKIEFDRMFPFLIFLFSLAMVYIANTYYAERTIRSIDKTTNEIKELSSEYISIKSELMFRSKPSQVAEAVADMGLKESRVAPRKIVVPQKQD